MSAEQNIHPSSAAVPAAGTLDYAPVPPASGWKESKMFPMWGVVMGGYLALGRPFAYWGIAPLFIGELYLMVQVLWNRHNWIGRFINNLFRFEPVSASIFLHLCWGGFEVFRSLYIGRPTLDSIRTAAFNYYPLYILIGTMIGKEISFQTYAKVWRLIVIVTLIHVLIDPVFPLSEGYGYSMSMPPVITLAMISLWDCFSHWKNRYLLVGITIFPDFFQSQHGHRSWVLGLLAGLLSIAATKPKQMLHWLVYAAGGFAILMIVGPLIPGPNGTSPPLDPFVQIAHITAANNPNLAIKMMKWRGYNNEVAAIKDEEGTAEWRKSIWTGIMGDLKTVPLQLMGEGEGTSLEKIMPNGEDIHTPHNISMYCLYYTGWVGLGIFSFMMFALLQASWRTRNPMLRRQLISTILAVIVITMTGNLLEAPFGAIPFYLIVGVALGLDQRQRTQGPKRVRRTYRLMDEPAEMRRPDRRSFNPMTQPI